MGGSHFPLYTADHIQSMYGTSNLPRLQIQPFYLLLLLKQQTGASPLGYNLISFQRVAVMLTPYASHLLLLGLEPAVTISESSEYLNLSDQKPPQSMKFFHTNSSAEQIKSLLVGPRNQMFIPVAVLLGGWLLLIADTVGRNLISPDGIPAGIMVALIGVPYIAYLLLKK
ncbi:putative siderophore transport system permease protein YfhA [compost metagenome]